MWSLAEMHTSVMVTCMPSMAKFIRRCYSEVTTKFSSPPSHDAPGPEQPTKPTNKPGRGRGPASRLLSAIANLTEKRRATSLSITGSSQLSLKKANSFNREPPGTIVDRDAPEYRDYVQYYHRYSNSDPILETELEVIESVVKARRQ